MKKFIVLIPLCFSLVTFSQERQKGNTDNNDFRQMYQEFSTPNVYRTAAGAPGHEYYQMQADYVMAIELDDAKQIVKGEETVTYHNNSPDKLNYLWVQLDQNMRAKDSDTKKISTSKLDDKTNFNTLKSLHNDFDGGFKLDYVKDVKGNDLPIAIVNTMMRIDLAKPLMPGEEYSFKVKWWYNINDRMKIGGRSGYEYFEDEDNYIYTIAQFFPRMAVYNDIEGWQNKQFLGRGEFTLPFGDYKVSLTVPSDHIIASTGALQNESDVLSATQRQRLAEARKSTEQPVIIANQKEAEEAEKTKATTKKTWVFHAENVRDFAFASSRKFIWDAQAVKFGNRTVLAMSYYPKEGNPLWEQYSTKVVAHTLKVYSKYTFDYPYPVAISVHTKQIGMEYPMICFNYGRPEKDGTYSDRTKYGMMGVIIHEVGHNFFPMIVNSDERQWTWMDEGLNTFCQFLTEQEWERDYPSRRGPAYLITDYMKGDKSKISPIMTNSESIFQFGNNAYGKPATGLNILRETILGRELFDYAFREYAQTWMFKHPTPEDFFRTMENASAVDLDWFWRGWFYTNDHVDLGISDVKWFKVDTKNPEVEKPLAKAALDSEEKFIGDTRNKTMVKQTVTEKDPSTMDFYNKYDPFDVTILDKEEYEKYIESLDEEELALLNADYNYYQVDLVAVGGLYMPVILEFTFEDGSTQVERIPVEIWKMNGSEVSKVFFFEKEVAKVNLDPFLETADTDRGNNYWPAKKAPTKFELYKRSSRDSENTMQKMRRASEMDATGSN
ncbi:MAG: hypothetical protein ACJAZ3_002101 [Sphingobacteriales bacterium]|jgi:hypothetical protein